MGINDLAELMGVSTRDAADFAAGVKLQMDRGMDLEAAIVAHRDSMTRAYEHMTRRCGNLAYGERMRGFVVDTFYAEAAR